MFLSESNLVEACSTYSSIADNTKRSKENKAKQKSVCLVQRSYQNNTCEITADVLQCTQTFLSKQVLTSNLVLQATLLGVKRPQCMASAFLGKCALITVEW